MTEIVKVQLPIVTTDPHEPALVYAKGKKKLVQQQLDHGTRKAMGEDMKAFFEAEFSFTKQVWGIGKRVKDRDW